MLRRKRTMDESQEERRPKKMASSESRNLQHLMRIRADTDEERWNLLKELDSVLYQGRDDREEDANLRGVCKDMCPEKER